MSRGRVRRTQSTADKTSDARRAVLARSAPAGTTRLPRGTTVNWSDAPPALLLVAMTILVYVPALSAGWIWDDRQYVWDNPGVVSVDGLRAIWFEPQSSQQYYPLVFTFFWLAYRLWGANPIGYHVTNVFLHAVNAVLLWRLLRRMNVPGAWLAA
ncbi:MAG TPA: hypothetical protein VL403_13765, partial [Candidatus Kryptonia bacterium]|nr:hypothetical protein [Candidatus Kryptonia bacterium]